MRYFLGIDAGGSKTECRVGDAERELSSAVGPSCKIQNVGETAAREVLRTTVKQACAIAGITADDLSAICIGFSGASNASVSAKVRAMLAELGPRVELELLGDNIIALEDICGSQPGVVVIAGTGSIAYGRDVSGKEARAGGLGPAASDEGSGGWIGLRALQALAAGRAAPLREQVVRLAERMGLPAPPDFTALAQHMSPADRARLVPAVLVAARERDAAACAILREAGEELARLASHVLHELWPYASQAVRVGMAGGVARHAGLVRLSFLRSLRASRSNVAVSFAVAEPARAALRRAQNLPGRRQS